MNILVTGAQGFIGKNLCVSLQSIKEDKDKTHPELNITDIYQYDVETDPTLLPEYCAKADFVFNLAGVNRPIEQTEYMAGNFGFASLLLDTLKAQGNLCPVMLSSSTQAALGNPYGQSKKAGEELFRRYAEETGAKVLIYRFPNVFGKWCRPNYNSAIATFCHNIANNLPITVNDPGVVMNLVYVDDVVDELIAALSGQENREGDFCAVPVVHTITLGAIADLLYSFKASREDLSVPDMSNAFIRKLHATYLSCLPEDGFSYPLKMNVDQRGSFTEIIRAPDRGQFSVNISKPGITKGNHWHHTKNEKFVVVHGHGLIQLRKVGQDVGGEAYPVQNYEVSGGKIQVVDMIPGYTHNIINLSDTEDLVTFMWASESFDPGRPDTYFETVEPDRGDEA